MSTTVAAWLTSTASLGPTVDVEGPNGSTNFEMDTSNQTSFAGLDLPLEGSLLSDLLDIGYEAREVYLLNQPLQCLTIVVIICLGVFFNVLVIHNICSNDLKMRSVNFLLIKNLCIADLVGVCMVLPMPLVVTAKGIWDFGPAICTANSIINITLWLQHIIMFGMLKVDRVMASCLPIGKYPLLSVEVVTVIIICTWLFSISMASLVSFLFKTSYEPAVVLCIPELPIEFFLTVFSVYCLVLFGMVTGYIFVLIHLKKKQAQITSQNGVRVVDYKALERAALTSFLITISHFLLYVPTMMVIGLHGWFLHPIAILFCDMVVYSEFLIHPVVLFITSTKLRGEVKGTLKKMAKATLPWVWMIAGEAYWLYKTWCPCRCTDKNKDQFYNAVREHQMEKKKMGSRLSIKVTGVEVKTLATTTASALDLYLHADNILPDGESGRSYSSTDSCHEDGGNPHQVERLKIVAEVETFHSEVVRQGRSISRESRDFSTWNTPGFGEQPTTGAMSSIETAADSESAEFNEAFTAAVLVTPQTLGNKTRPCTAPAGGERTRAGRLYEKRRSLHIPLFSTLEVNGHLPELGSQHSSTRSSQISNERRYSNSDLEDMEDTPSSKLDCFRRLAMMDEGGLSSNLGLLKKRRSSISSEELQKLILNQKIRGEQSAINPELMALNIDGPSPHQRSPAQSVVQFPSDVILVEEVSTKAKNEIFI
ncbi:hypothetical protein TCAL_08472 [Tigriopus californicus]|uniref:G-protein coupled receptors family 1 profile domain-containing protein n=1 Tax=Tigriopus californicus TaxID=6832 RepID=A0A553N8W0_TIGCA|nr:uncharacterized protein LOC131885209 [Tigriopus californicus]XP_059089150.1 uncharacterized protein LOC131885209 [Tigriopus californicus]TRY61871.1 hypothetical protein TCAL_08472 [Tigriopus californicus]|eukprot:TCALIF_08472-PA protein Name:"Similar to OPRM1 Mu-type opioid receptor (Macaca fascicularis)" AED:0.41 eAED:0.41 QI:0/0/0/0.5/1/1/2/0/707